MVNIFITGATGYIGGDVLFELAGVHSNYQITCLVRSKEGAQSIKKSFPNVRTVVGSLDSTDLVTAEAANADVILNLAASNHASSVDAIISGIKSAKKTPSLVQISGASIFALAEIQSGAFGQSSTLDLDDIKDSGLLENLANEHPVRVVDRKVLALTPSAKTAVVCPACIYGAARGPGNQRSIQIPDLIKGTLIKGQGIIPGAGKAAWSQVHVQDLSKLIVKVVDEMVNHDTAKADGIWEFGGYYFAASEMISWGEIGTKIAVEAQVQGFLDHAKVVSLTKEETDGVTPKGSVLYGTNARCISSKAAVKLGWKPTAQSLGAVIREGVREEALRAGIVAKSIST